MTCKRIAVFFTCSAACLLTGCRCNVAVSFGKPAVAVQVSPQHWDGNSLDGTMKLADEVKATGP